jgi:hypothetical protein
MAARRSLYLKRPPVVRRREIDERPDRHDAGRIHVALTALIMPLDMIDAHGLRDAGHLIEIAQII